MSTRAGDLTARPLGVEQRAAVRARPSLLDRVDLSAVRRAADGLEGPYATVAACLVTGRVLEHDPDEPDWSDRDRVVAGDPRAGALGAALAAVGHPAGGGIDDVPGWEALPRAAGLAAASRLDGGIFRIWCLLDATAVDHGATWEAARMAASARLDTLVGVVVAPRAGCAEAARVLGAAAWRVTQARAGDPAEVLGALDHALAADVPALVTAVVA